MSVGKGKTKVHGDGPAVSQETLKSQPHSLGTYSLQGLRKRSASYKYDINGSSET